MRILLLILLLAGHAQAQTLPEEIKDPVTNRVAQYLDQEVRKALTKIAVLESTTTATGAFSVTVSSADITGTIAPGPNRCNECVAGSTVTATGLRYDICYRGGLRSEATANNAFARAGYLIDGACPDGFICDAATSTNRMAIAWEIQGNGEEVNGSFCDEVLFGVSAARQFCFIACQNSTAIKTGHNSRGKFYIKAHNK